MSNSFCWIIRLSVQNLSQAVHMDLYNAFRSFKHLFVLEWWDTLLNLSHIEQPSSCPTGCTIQRSCEIGKPMEIHRSRKTGLIRPKLMQQSYITSAENTCVQINRYHCRDSVLVQDYICRKLTEFLICTLNKLWAHIAFLSHATITFRINNLLLFYCLFFYVKNWLWLLDETHMSRALVALYTNTWYRMYSLHTHVCCFSSITLKSLINFEFGS